MIGTFLCGEHFVCSLNIWDCLFVFLTSDEISVVGVECGVCGVRMLFLLKLRK